MDIKEKTTKKQKIIVGAALVTALALFILLTVIISLPIVKYAAKPELLNDKISTRFGKESEKLKDIISDLGFGGKLLYIGISALQVIIALIPGEPVEILGGYAFGAFEGTLLYLIGAFIGSMAVFWLVRRFGKKIASIFFSEKKIASLRFLRSSPKKNVLLITIFTIPGTPKDLIAYYAGLTDIKTWVWALVCFFGRIPSVITSAISGSALGDSKFSTAIATVIVTLIISAVGLLVYKMICRKNTTTPKE